MNCDVETCSEPRQRRTWCSKHYRRWLRYGSPVGGKYAVAAKAAQCVGCGLPDIAPGMRLFCSVACRQAEYRARGRIPREHCATCGVDIRPYRREGKASGRSDARFCADCRSRPRRSYRLAVVLLAHYQGSDCGICEQPVDMDVRFPDKQCASVDHILPLADGGSDDATNLRLAHYSCNAMREALLRNGLAS